MNWGLGFQGLRVVLGFHQGLGFQGFGVLGFNWGLGWFRVSGVEGSFRVSFGFRVQLRFRVSGVEGSFRASLGFRVSESRVLVFN